MSAADVPLRVEFEKALAQLRALATDVSSIMTRLALLESLLFIRKYNDYTDVQAATVPQAIGMIVVITDYNDNNGIFVRDGSYTPIIEGADGISDVAGATFKRFQNE